MDFLVYVGHGNHDTDEITISNALDPLEAACAATALVLATRHDGLEWYVIDVLPIFPMPKGKH
jgi:hypothetical protein